jgi:hypothetical protein
MTPVWIDAALALDIATDGGSKPAAIQSICQRAHAGLIRSIARTLTTGEEQQSNVGLPKKFWWAEGHEALEQNWTTGDFSTWIDNSIQLQAFGVRFALDDILELLPIEHRGIVAKRHSVAGNPDWLSANDACSILATQEAISFFVAGRKIIDQAKLGFVIARAVEMKSKSEGRFHTENIEREWDVPTWFWSEYCEAESSTQNWETGKFKGRSYVSSIPRTIELSDVRFLKSSIASPSNPASGEMTVPEHRPDLSNAELERWWASMAGAREALTQDQLLLLIRDKYPDNFIARDRIRDLSSGRKPGKKPLGG